MRRLRVHKLPLFERGTPHSDPEVDMAIQAKFDSLRLQR